LAILAAGHPVAQVANPPRVVYFSSLGPESNAYTESFRAGLRELGYVEGKNFILDIRLVDLDNRRVGEAVDEVLKLKPAVLVSWETGALIMRSKTKTVPIVIYGAVDPVKAGLVESLRRPGGNVTGISQMNYQLPAKHIEIAREIYPAVSRLGIFVDEGAVGCKFIEESAQQAARLFKVRLISYRIRDGSDIERAFRQIEGDRPDVLLPCPSPVLFNHRQLLFETAARLRIPFTSFIVANVPDGVLFAYAADMHDHRRRAAAYVDKILKGANPANLPIEQPTNFQLVVNLRTAKALGLAIPRQILLRADRIIE
jgi:putative ABC transport system substrate-binding protein